MTPPSATGVVTVAVAIHAPCVAAFAGLLVELCGRVLLALDLDVALLGAQLRGVVLALIQGRVVLLGAHFCP